MKYESFMASPTGDELKEAVAKREVDEALLQFFFSWSDAMRGWEKWMSTNHPHQRES